MLILYCSLQSQNKHYMEKLNYVSYPKVRMRQDGLVEIIVYFNGKRMRLQSGKRFGISLRPNTFPQNERMNQGKVLAAEIYRRMLLTEPIIKQRKYRSNQGRNPERQSVSVMAVVIVTLLALIALISNLFMLWTRQ